MKLVRHTALRLVLENLVTGLIKDGSELLRSTHDTIVLLVKQESTAARDVLLDKDEARLATILALRQAGLFCLDHERH